MQRVAAAIAGVASSVEFLTWGEREHDDAADFFEQGGTAEQLDRLLAEAGPTIGRAVIPHGRAAAKPPTSSGLDVISAQEILATNYPEVRWAVPGLVPVGLSLLAGRPKIGKSWLALNLAIAVDAGGPFLGHRETPRGGALFLALEDSPRRMKDRIAALTTSAPGRLCFLFQLARVDHGGLEALDAWLEAHSECRLVILDVFNRIRPPKKRDVDQYQEDAEVAAKLQTLALRRNVALLVVHHDRKAGSDDWLDTVSGTFGLSGSADVVALLTRERGTSHGRLRLTGRDIEEQDLALDFSRGLWSVLGPGEELSATPERRKILAALREAGKPMAPAAIATTAEMDLGVVRHLLGKLKADGMVRQPAYGLYTVHSDHSSIPQ